MSRPPRDPGPLPNRWLHCPRIGHTVIAEKFLPFKTPLSSRFNAQISSECQFEPDLVFSFVKMMKVKMGLWFDLTNTSRFYDRRTIEDRAIQYVKLNCRGHGETPSPEQTQSFIEFVDSFIANNPLDVIGVHCTHGFNRTGFLIVSYMVEKMDCSVEAAILEFAKARPPGIYKADYIKELFRRYDDEDDALPAPQMPDWCFEYSDGDREEGNGLDDDAEEEAYSNSHAHKRSHENDYDDDDDSSEVCGIAGPSNDINSEDGRQNDGETSRSSATQIPRKKRRKEQFNPNATFMPDVPGVMQVIDQPRLGELQVKAQEMCGWKSNGFPGCQPVSMDVNNINFLSRKPYWVSWKADGTRYMMLIQDEDEIFFFDRDHSCFQISGLTFPHPSDLQRHLKDTLLDGEMVIDIYQGKKTPRYLVYDVVKYDGNDVSKPELYKSRLDCIRKHIVEPRYEAMKRGLIRREFEPISVRLKEFYEITHTQSLLGPKFAKMLCHEPDGLIFQPGDIPYKAGACSEVLKWKPIELNSVDFLLKIDVEQGAGIVTRKIGLLYVGQQDRPFATIKFTKSLTPFNNKIIECKFDKQQKSWIFMRQRQDKSYPNSYNTAKAVCQSIQNPVKAEMLLDFIARYRYREPINNRETEIMPPPQNVPRQR